jgi:hypothetical protein
VQPTSQCSLPTKSLPPVTWWPVFHIQALLLVEGIAMFDASPQVPVRVEMLGSRYVQERHIGEQGQGSVLQVVFDSQDPQGLMCVGEADREPAILR